MDGGVRGLGPDVLAPAEPGSANDWLRRMAAERPDTGIAAVAAEVAGRVVTIRLKLEAESRWGSIKDRTAMNLIASVADRLSGAAPVVVESTSGNLGVALAAICASLRVRFIAVVDPTLPPVLADRMRDDGAELDLVTAGDRRGYLAARIGRVGELCSRLPNAVWTDQYHNPANPGAHYEGTARELDRQLGQAMDAVFVAVSTGGTLAGLGRYMHRFRPGVQVVAIDVAGSQVFGPATGRRLLTGIGASRRSTFLRPGDYDDVQIVEEEAAIACCHALAESAGLWVGGSSGAVLAGCLRYLAAHPEISTPICLCPDGGDSYQHSVYDQAWLTRHAVKLSDDMLRPAPGAAPARFARLDTDRHRQETS